jgi:dihydrofolate synthase/folylpolyglutamate synthase
MVETMAANDIPGYELGRPSHFEVIFCMMADYFARMGVQWAVCETGMGGRLDATNTLDSDVAVITNVSLEHTEVLGDTPAQIAREKAAIIKCERPVVTAAHVSEVLEVIREYARAASAPLTEVGRDVRFEVGEQELGRQNLTVWTEDGHSISVVLPLAGSHQAWNAATAIAAVGALSKRGTNIDLDCTVRGLESVTIPGRMEIVRWEPLVILDGAHNPAGAQQLDLALTQLFGDRPVVVCFAALTDKDIDAMAAAISGSKRDIVLTTAPGTSRAARPTDMLASFTATSANMVVEPDPAAAVRLGLQLAERGRVLVIAGSMYLVGFARRYLRENPG